MKATPTLNERLPPLLSSSSPMIIIIIIIKIKNDTKCLCVLLLLLIHIINRLLSAILLQEHIINSYSLLELENQIIKS